MPTLVAALLCAAVAAGQEVSVRVAPVAPAKAGPHDVRLVVERRDGGPVVVRQVPARAEDVAITLRLDPGSYVARVDDPHYWSPDAQFDVPAASPTAVAVRLWPVQEWDVPVSVAAGIAPETLSLAFRGPPSADEAIRVPPGFTTCRVERGLARCRLPAGTLDLSFRAPGFVPEYLWDTDKTLGHGRRPRRLLMSRGSSVAGYVLDSSRQPARGARVELTTPTGAAIPASPPSPHAGGQPRLRRTARCRRRRTPGASSRSEACPRGSTGSWRGRRSGIPSRPR